MKATCRLDKKENVNSLSQSLVQYRNIQTVMLNNAYMTASIIKIYFSPNQYFTLPPLKPQRLGLVATFGGTKVGERKATRSKMKLRIKKERKKSK